ncbi:MAG: L-histidine N(alpha)-methyltransferase [Pseudomonadota bacterium]
MSEAAFELLDLQPALGLMREEVLAGLEAPVKVLSPKYFYDAAGSALFEQITELPEYYLTRTEIGLFDAHSSAIAAAIGRGSCVVEYGSGSNLKIRKLLEAAAPAAYVPVDISREHLEANARALQADFPDLDLYPICTDITTPFELPAAVAALTKIGFFPGSSIGNFEPRAAVRLLATIRATLGAGQFLLLGVDRKKDPAVLEAAYDDAAGITAAFNRNILRHLNEALDGNFDPDAFRHVAAYDAAAGCVQMFLEATAAQDVVLAGQRIRFAAGERIHTENSFKYHPTEFEQLAGQAGFAVNQFWTDADALYGLFLLKATD